MLNNKDGNNINFGLSEKEDINTKIAEVGFHNVISNSFFMTKVWSAVK